MKTISMLVAAAAALVGTTFVAAQRGDVAAPQATVTAGGAKSSFVIPPRQAEAAPAPASTTPVLTWTGGRLGCTVITELPYDIRRPGRYCLDRDLVTPSGSGIRIEASSVLLDCRGFAVSTPPSGPMGFNGIEMWSGTASTIHNCRVSGFRYGIVAFPGVVAPRILNNSVDSVLNVGIGASGDNAEVIGNRVTNVGSTSPTAHVNAIVLYPASSDTPARGQVVARNMVANVHGGEQMTGIDVAGSNAPLIEGNSVIGLRPTDTGQAIGLRLRAWSETAATSGARVVGNHLMSQAPGYVDFTRQDAGAAAECSRNVSIGVATSELSSCPSETGNRIVP